MSTATKSDRYQPIAGSNYLRDYCASCQEPIRIASSREGKENYCWDCQPSGRGMPAVGAGRRVQDDDANGCLANARRAMEG